MLSMNVVNFLFLVVFVLTLTGCMSKKSGLESNELLHEDLIKLGYEPIIPPSTLLEPGTVIGYSGEIEVIKVTRSSCSIDYIKKEHSPTQIANKVYSFNRTNKASADLAKVSSYDIDIEALLELNRIGKVTYEFVKPFIWSVDGYTIEQHFKNSPSGCMDRAVANGNVIIHQVLGANGLRLSFYDNSDNKITAKAELIQILNTGGSSTSLSIENGSIVDNQELFYGYRVFDGFYGAGLSDTEKRDSFYVKEANEKIKELKN